MPGVGFLRGEGPDSLHPCTPYPDNNPPLFQSNQISAFSFNPDTSGGARGGSGGVNSCWLATYNTPHEMPMVSIASPANHGVYLQGSNQTANYSCAAVNNSNVNNGLNGPYLTVASCSGPVPTGTAFDTSTTGPHSFAVNVQDSALNVNSETVNYMVATSLPAFTSGNSATFTVGVFGSFTVTTSGFPSPSIKESGSLPNGLTFVDNGDGTGTLRGTPLVLIGGNFSVTFTAKNGVGSPATQVFTIVLRSAPGFTSANNAIFAYGVPNSFKVTTTGFPVPSLSKSGALPPGITFVDNGDGTGALAGTPTLTSGAFPLVLYATNAVTTTTQNFTLTVAGLSASPSSLNFGTVQLNSSHSLSLTLTNVGTSTVTISGANITPSTANASTYSFVSHCQSPLKAGKSCTIAVTFLGNALGTLTATLNVTDNAVGSPQHIILTGNVIDPVAQFNPARLAFGTEPVGSSTTLPVQLTNAGQTPLIISGISIVGANSAGFFQSNNCPVSLSPPNSCTILVTFAPAAKGARTGTLTVTDNVAAGQSPVALTATGH